MSAPSEQGDVLCILEGGPFDGRTVPSSNITPSGRTCLVTIDGETAEYFVADTESRPMRLRFSSVPVHKETMAGALIDSARISVMAARSMLPPQLIIPVSDPVDTTPEFSVDECLDQAMSWLDAARIQTIENGAPVTSLHIAGARR